MGVVPQSRQNIKIILYLASLVVLVLCFVIFTLLLHRQFVKHPTEDTVVVAVPYSERLQDYESNYYTVWLEEKTGYDIRFVYLDEGYERESLATMLTSKNGSVDAVFLPADQEILSFDEYQTYIREGYLAPPEDYLVPDSNLREMSESYSEVYFEKLLGEDGKVYCFPSMDMARTGRNMQILWINVDWLANLNLPIPRTVGEFSEVLAAFREKDPNGNGIADELALVSCEADRSFRSYLYLLNAFSYCNVENLSWYGRGTEVAAGVEQEEFREGVSYCARLYGDGLLVDDAFSYTARQLMELVNDPADIVGAFASHSIADVIYTNNPNILAHFVQLPPLSSEALDRGYAVRTGVLPSLGGLIPANAVHKEEAAKIMDLMISEEASLIALYGEEGVDWRFSRDGELSTYGTRARVTTIRYLKRERQNKNYAGVGPLMAAAEFTDGVTWNGDHSMTEYIDARAVKSYEPYYRQDSEGERRRVGEALRALDPATRSAAAEYLESGILSFIRGDRDVENDAEWGQFLAEYRRMLG